MKIERRNDKKNWKNSRNEFSNQIDSEMSSQNRQTTIEKNHRKRRWLRRRIDEKKIFQRWNDTKCLICRSICERADSLQIDQLLNAKQRHRHSRLQRFRSISVESSNWFERSASNRYNRLRHWELWNDEYCCQKIDDSINIQLLNVALMLEFFINLICLIKMMKKKVHWDIESKRLHRKEIIFCFVESVENHWVLENNSSNQTFKTFEAKSEASKFDLMITNRKWHEMLEHSRSKIIAHFAERVNEVKIENFESASSINRCETCVLIKTHEIVFRRIDQKESIDHSLSRVDYDLISMNEKYNENFWINHFVDFYTRMNFVYTHSRKNDAFSMIREFLKTIRIRYDQIVRFIRMNDKRILEFEYREFMKLREIVTKRFVSYTSSQNDKIERFEKILMIKIRVMRIKANLSANMWSKMFKSIDYLNNRTLKRALRWKISFEILIEKKSNLSHLQSYECKTYLLKNIILRKNRLKSKAFIDYLVKYDFTNVFRIWIFSRMRIIRIRNVLFDKTFFYDLAKLDSKHLLIINVKDTLKILKISNNIFFEMIIEKDDETDQMIDHLEDKSIESRFMKSIYQVEKTFFLHIDMKNIYLLIFEMISDRDQKFNANTIDTMLLLQIDLKIDEILNSD